jgi:N-hydroxyarylamine O-acetyltransferase
MTDTLDLDAYFERIAYDGPTAPTYATLARLVAAHMDRIPFENLDVLLGRGIRIDLASVQSKLVDARRGGYCFEHVTLFAAVLERLGFTPVRHTARVVLVATRTTSPRAHMFVTVPLPEGTFVVDPGFGGLAPRVPVPLADGHEVRVGAEAHAMVQEGGLWVLRARSGGGMIDGWVSPLDVDNLVDFEVGNHYTATHPDSPFVSHVMLRALTQEGRVTVMNRGATITRNGVPEAVLLHDRRALRALVAEHFGFDLPEIEQMRVPSVPEWN